MNNELFLDDVIEVAYALAVKFMQYDQPINHFERIKHEIDMGKLEGAVRAPFQTSRGEYLLSDFYLRASALFYYLSKSHALVNGNKRLAVTSLMVFVAKNDKWIEMSNEKLIELSVMIASYDGKYKNIIIEAVSKIIREHVVKWNIN